MPREWSSGETQLRGGITKTGNRRARAMLVQAAWGGWRDRHPDTDAQITGRVLPLWAETQALAARAHAAFADRLLIGWDIAITRDGPVLIEGNSGPDLDIIQRVYGEPLGNARFGELIALHLRRVTGLPHEPHVAASSVGHPLAPPKGVPS